MATRGLPDAVGLATRDFMLDNARLIAAAVDLPVQADLENGFGDSPEIVAQTILEASATGIVGGSIEDTTGARPTQSIRSSSRKSLSTLRPRWPVRLGSEERFKSGFAGLDKARQGSEERRRGYQLIRRTHRAVAFGSSTTDRLTAT